MAMATAVSRSLIVLTCLSGCMLTPTDDRRVSRTTSPLSFQGYTTEASAPVQVRAWDFEANAMANVGAAVRSVTAATNVGGTSLYGWSASRALEPRFWRSGPAGGHCAAVGANTIVGGRTHNVMTVESNWGECYRENPTVGGFYANCASSNSPVAKIYTTSWGSIAVSQARLDRAGALASALVRLRLDNFTSTPYEFCSGSTPEGCPPELSADPETYKFYAPNASLLSANGERMTFSITPPRSDPMTAYIDDMTSSRVDFRAVGDRFVFGITFEAAGTEIRLDCIRNVACAFVGRAIDFAAPRAELSFTLAVEDGRVTYTDVSTVFTTGTAGGEAASAASGIAEAITEKLMNDSGVRGAVNAALDAVIRGAADTGPFTIEDVTIRDGAMEVLPGCPMD
ncbi:MAG: hypothetical protein HY698_05125 [Deltaproteobacteria bacterium]|nr:hypothetical protein [Deltaproteobacteria bacterium]